MKSIALIIAVLILSLRGYSQSNKHSQFEWAEFATDDTIFEKAAILVPLHIDGIETEYYMQLDLGSNATMFYGIPFEQICKENPLIKKNRVTISKHNKEVEVLPVSGKLGDYVLKSDTFYIKQNYGDSLRPDDKLQVVGTIGQDIFNSRILMIDFINERFALRDSIEELDETLLSNTDTIKVKIRFNKMFVSGIKVGDQPLNNIIYDSGSSIFSLVVTKKKWQELTGRTGDELNNTIINIPAWQKEVEVIGAPMEHNLQLGIFEFQNLIIYYGLLEGLDLSKAPFILEGLIGNALFLDSIIVIDFEKEIMMIKK